MSDVWRVPPGAAARTLPRRRQFRLKPFIALIVISALVIGGANLYVAVHRSTAVSTKDALAEFRAEQAHSPHHARGPHRSVRNGEARSPDGDHAAHESGNRATDTRGSAAGGGTANGNSTSSGLQSENRSTQASDRRAARPATRTKPEAGVYTWEVDGYEDLPGVHRELPRESHRIITYENGGWVEHHIFSEQKEEWFHLSASPKGVTCSEVRNRVESGPVTVDKTVVFDPPAFASLHPFALGQTWEGSWSGKTSGEYKGKTIDHGNLTIGGDTVEVWVTEVVMHMQGDVSGTVVTRSWIAPEVALVVKQYQDSRVDAGPGDYHSEWTGQVTSIHPQR